MAHDFSDVASALGLLAWGAGWPISGCLQMKAVRIVVFVKAPLAGFAKTRLIPALGQQGAADLAQRLLEHTLDEALKSQVGPVELCVTPSASDPVWQTMPLPEAVRLTDQGEGDLGARMARATERVIDAGESILLIGTDCPQLDADQLRRAALALQHAQATLVPAFDGGYVLLGLTRFDSSVFSGITWSTESVMNETMARLNRLGWRVKTIPTLHDIDEPSDLKYLPKPMALSLRAA
ncbi:TIGR04282 family arsenosugar biosynthesis glycosyltransferase [Rhodoferax sp.]|uniref:TIGR04282 family arsenosugar biosynthesis glycosyltransferase n=1 Tax=Rhodoferax sp. TaxID=50421 RepID=UPI0027305300|nr:TIGR04282 family arsenosugar biosynthesis glycosyltransferase [Rhodoferax sp.]MDP2440107.1 TIGR04282 family arsenosugar biosynthesis glycosyltransferase [Rhodoferax sp.]